MVEDDTLYHLIVGSYPASNVCELARSEMRPCTFWLCPAPLPGARFFSARAPCAPRAPANPARCPLARATLPADSEFAASASRLPGHTTRTSRPVCSLSHTQLLRVAPPGTGAGNVCAASAAPVTVLRGAIPPQTPGPLWHMAAIQVTTSSTLRRDNAMVLSHRVRPWAVTRSLHGQASRAAGGLGAPESPALPGAWDLNLTRDLIRFHRDRD